MPLIKRAVLLSFLLFVLSDSILAQISDKRKLVSQRFVEQADEVMKSTAATSVAKELYIQAARIDPENIEANFKAGQLYLETIDKDRAVPHFKKVKEIDPDYHFGLDYLIGLSYHYGLQFDNAIEHYRRYEEKLKENPSYSGKDKFEAKDVERRIIECYNGKEFVSNPLDYSIKNLGADINSVYDDYAPVIDKDNTLLIFTTRRKVGNMSNNVDIDNVPFEDVFYSNYRDDKWQKAQNIGEPVNNEFHNSNLSLSADGKILFLYTDANNGDILVSNKNEDGTWSEPESIGPNINSLGFKESSVCLSPDGETLYFSSNRPGGYGGSDIYYSKRDKRGDWKKAKNLGSVINTEFDDDSPFIDFSGDFLYFSSKGHKGMGGYDIFKSEYLVEEESWSEPENLGYPINTSDNDIYFVVSNDGGLAYYSTVRGGGFGLTDIYSIKKGKFEIPEDPDTTSVDTVVKTPVVQSKNVILNLRVKDESGNLIAAKTKLTNVSDESVAARKKMDDGYYKFKIESPKNEAYRISVEKDGYAFVNENILINGSPDEITEIDKTVILKALKLGTNKVLRNVYFDFNKASIKPSSFDELEKVEDMLARNPNIEIELGGHTDNIGDASFNKELSMRRVQQVKRHLVKNGIDPRRITTVGYGEEKPLATNDDEKEGRELNRRVEFTVIKE